MRMTSYHRRRCSNGRRDSRPRRRCACSPVRDISFTAASTSCATWLSSSCRRLLETKGPGEFYPPGPRPHGAEETDRYEFTIAFRLLSGITRTFLLAGLALNIIFSPVKGLTPSRALVAGFFTTFILSSPGNVNRPLPRRLFLITVPSDSKTLPTCLRERPVSLEMCVRTSDFVGAPPFFAILRYSSRD